MSACSMVARVVGDDNELGQGAQFFEDGGEARGVGVVEGGSRLRRALRTAKGWWP